MTYAVVTLGCKLNQHDSARVAGRLGGAPEARHPEEADLILLNTCTVTHRADREARRLARALKRANPRAIVAVMGCGAILHEASFRSIPEVDEVLADASAVEAFLARHRAPSLGCGGWRPHFGERTRALLKVQEGCDFPCAYCIVPSVRGPSRSVPVEEVSREFRALLGEGFREIVITGINTGEYGKDLGFKAGLPGLLEALMKAEGRYRIRLNSVEPKAVTPALVSLLRREPSLAKHLQVPLQSGSDRVLRAMRRNYRASTYEALIARLAGEVPGIGLGADVLAGYPAETAQDFEETVGLIERSPLAFLHAFSYSPRPGTRAAPLAPLDPREVHARTAALRALGERKRSAFSSSFVGKELEALTLAPGGGKGRALTTNFLDLRLSHPAPPNRFVRVLVTGTEGGTVTGRIVSESEERFRGPFATPGT